MGMVKDFAMCRNRVAVYSNQLIVQDGPLNAPWNHVSNAGAFDLT